MLVTPFVGVWIEMPFVGEKSILLRVTPFVGVWIEILFHTASVRAVFVTPFVGVWIEIMLPPRIQPNLSCHSLRGSVD